jgi:hypothetical protein
MDPPPLTSPVDFSGMRPLYPVPEESSSEDLKGRPKITLTEMSSGIRTPEAIGNKDRASAPSNSISTPEPTTISSSSVVSGPQQPDFDLPIRDRLKSHMSHVLITDDNVVNRRVSTCYKGRVFIKA